MTPMLAELHRAHVQRRIRLDGTPKLPPVRVKAMPPAMFRKAFIIKQIVNRVSEDFGLLPHEITGTNRCTLAVKPRFIAVYLARAITRLSLPSLGKQFGGRDHSTISNAIDRTIARACREFNFGADLAALECVMRRQSP